MRSTDSSSVKIAAGAAFHYVSDTRQDQLKHVSGISRITEENYVWLDRFTIRNLELVSSANENALTLLDVIDKTITPMGARLLKRWLLMPLKEIKAIEERQLAVSILQSPVVSQQAAPLPPPIEIRPPPGPPAKPKPRPPLVLTPQVQSAPRP